MIQLHILWRAGSQSPTPGRDKDLLWILACLEWGGTLSEAAAKGIMESMRRRRRQNTTAYLRKCIANQLEAVGLDYDASRPRGS
jgi:hypothetical protein